MYSSYAGMGYERFVNVAGWNHMAAANIGVSLFLCVQRFATVMGFFAKTGGAKGQMKKA